MLLIGVGCASRYKVTLTNDGVITSKGKPRLNQDKSAYEFKDIQGKRRSIPAFRIKEIEPL